jgi:hypothetical protein
MYRLATPFVPSLPFFLFWYAVIEIPMLRVVVFPLSGPFYYDSHYRQPGLVYSAGGGRSGGKCEGEWAENDISALTVV